MSKHDGLDGIVEAAKKDPRFKKMKTGDAAGVADEEGEADGEKPSCPKCGHREGHE